MCDVKRRSFLSLSATVVGGGLIVGKAARGSENPGQGASGGVHHRVHTLSLMTETTNRSSSLNWKVALARCSGLSAARKPQMHKDIDSEAVGGGFTTD